jgi:hemoglobin
MRGAAAGAPIVVEEPAARDARRSDAAQASLYDRLGGDPGVDAIARAFVAHVRSDAKLARPLAKVKPETNERLEENFKTFFCHAAGGGCSDAHMPDSLRALDITESEWRAAISDLAAAYVDVGVGASERMDLDEAIASFHDDIVLKKRRGDGRGARRAERPEDLSGVSGGGAP